MDYPAYAVVYHFFFSVCQSHYWIIIYLNRLANQNVAARCSQNVAAWRCKGKDHQKVVSLTPGQFAIKWLLIEWVTVCRVQTGKLSLYMTSHLGQLSYPSLWGR